VVRVFDLLRRDVPSKLLFVGEGPERLFVKQLVKELGLSEHVHFLGEQDYLENVLSCVDLLLGPSEQESFCLVALEAMNCGVPVVGTAVGGLPEVVTHGETGFLFPVGEIRAMADAAIDLLSNPEKHRHFASAARTRAAAEFDSKKIIPQYEALYERLL
jgi:N-acetyl-alpha-D-glucosaminyl L-malate synthase BshA